MANRDDVEIVVSKHFQWLESDFFETACDALGRISKEDWEADAADAVRDALSNALIYTDDEWAVLKHYCLPRAASMVQAEEAFFDDLYSMASELFTDED